MQKTITFAIPCYNSAAYMDHCIESILEGSDYAKDVQIVIVDDGSTKDDTAMRADLWQARHPDIIKAVHQENGGHGIAVMAGVKAADGVYYKVVDSDDWLDIFALQKLLETLRHFIEFDTRVDLVITNYVYEHVEDGKQNIVDYRYALPRGKIITWDKIGHFNMAPEPAHALAVLSRRHPARRWRADALAHLLRGQHLCLRPPAALQDALLPRRRPLPLLHRPWRPIGERVRHDQPHRPAAAHHARHDARLSPLRRGRIRQAAQLHGVVLHAHDGGLLRLLAPLGQA
jgi:hypothetical protein